MNNNEKSNLLKLTKILFEPLPNESQEAKDKFAEILRLYQEEQRKLDKKLSGK